jgi:two-component system, NarL family, response regulator NreC
MIKVIILDDHQLFIDGIINSFTGDNNIKIVDYALDGASGLAKIKSLKPDVVILDIDFSKTGETGIDLLRLIRQVEPTIKVLILTGHCDTGLIDILKQEGANGYRLKNIDLEDLKQAILDISSGQITFKYDSVLLKSEKKWGTNTQTILSDRAIEIIKLLSQGLIVKEISQRLGIAETTVNDHLERTKRKLGAKNNCELVFIAGKNGII